MKKKSLVIISSIVAVILVAVVSWFIFIENRKYEVNFNSDGGSAVEAQEVKNKNQATKPADPTKAKHDFVGWYLNDEEFDFITPITENIELTAKWVLSDLVMECNVEDKQEGVLIKGRILAKFDPTTYEIKDADGFAEITFPDSAILEKMKQEAKVHFCPKNIDESKCVITINENVLRLDMKNEKNIVNAAKPEDVETFNLMEDIREDLERGGFICEMKED